MDTYNKALQELTIHKDQKTQLQIRVLPIIELYKSNRLFYSICYYGGKSVVTLGSILVPSLMTRDLYNNSMDVYWFVFIISLFVTIANGFLTAFNIDTKFYVTQNVYFQVQSEFWQYYGLSGKYSGFYVNGILNHANQCKYFLNNIEKINMNYIERIYSKNIEKIDNKNVEELIKRVVPSNYPIDSKIEKSPTKDDQIKPQLLNPVLENINIQ
jgi:hypothetical protein